jgi:hypothetical protein
MDKDNLFIAIIQFNKSLTRNKQHGKNGFALHLPCLKTFFTALGRVGFFHLPAEIKSFVPDVYIGLTGVVQGGSFTPLNDLIYKNS